jgi:hypothetical protein
MKVGIVLLCLLFGVATASVRAQVTPQTIQPFKSLCIDEQASGLDWENGKWENTKFKPGKYILEKIDYEKSIISEKFLDRPISCTKPIATKLDNENSIVTACYVVKKFGKVESNFMAAEDCYESFKNGKIESIYCKGTGKFMPNGQFIKLPASESLDISSTNIKSSIVVSAGTCGLL